MKHFNIFRIIIAFIIAAAVVNFVIAIVSGDINLATWIADNRFLVVIGVCYCLLKFVAPFKKEK